VGLFAAPEGDFGDLTDTLAAGCGAGSGRRGGWPGGGCLLPCLEWAQCAV